MNTYFGRGDTLKKEILYNLVKEKLLVESEEMYNITQFTGSCHICNAKLFWLNDFDGEDVFKELTNSILSYWECSKCGITFIYVSKY